MLPKLHHKKGGKNRRVLNIVAIVSGILFSCLVLFLALDSFTLYWFTLLNKDSALEARRNEDFEWYDSFADGATGGGPTGKPAPGYNSNFSGSGCEYAMSEVVKTLTLEEMQTKETAMRFFIYLMDCNGYTPNAIVGAMSYMYQEGAALGTFTYESYKYCTGPSGVYKDFTLDNNAWLNWLDGDGLRQAIVLYKNMRDGGKPVGYAAIGLGLTQESDTWSSDGSKGTHRATDLINFANSKGGYWQYPNIQMLYYEQKFQGDVAWDLDDCPGPDPKSSTEITATEWAGRVLCGIGMPGWSYTNCLDSVNYPNSYASLQSHIAGVPDAQELYDKYSGKDPWFYNADGSQIYTSPNSNPISPNGFTWGTDPCPSCGKTGSNDWHCPFCGPVYDNSTTQGLLIARMALLLSGDTQLDIKGNGGYNDPALVADASQKYYREAQKSVPGDNGTSPVSLFASCDHYATLCIRMSGIDITMKRTGAGYARGYMLDHPEKWKYLGTGDKVQLQAGDVLVRPNYDYDPNGTVSKTSGGHIYIYIGHDVASERWPGSNYNVLEASWNEYFPGPSLYREDGTRRYGNTAVCFVFRAVNPDWDGKYWNSFMETNASKFPELPKTYPYSKTA